MRLVRSLPTLAITTLVMADKTHPDTQKQCLALGVSHLLPPQPNNTDLLKSLAAAFDLDDAVPAAPTSPQPSASPAMPSSSGKVEALQQLLSIDKLHNLLGLGSDTASETLTDLTGGSIHFQSPAVETMTAQSLQQLLKGRFGADSICAVQLPFIGGLNGTAQLFFSKRVRRA